MHYVFMHREEESPFYRNIIDIVGEYLTEVKKLDKEHALAKVYNTLTLMASKMVPQKVSSFVSVSFMLSV